MFKRIFQKLFSKKSSVIAKKHPSSATPSSISNLGMSNHSGSSHYRTGNDDSCSFSDSGGDCGGGGDGGGD